MERFLGKFEPYIYAILRIIAGFLLFWHGTQKLFGFPPPKQAMALNGMLTAAGVIELVCGLLIIVGLFAGFAAFIASGMLAVAYFMVHAPNGFLPIEEGGNGGERAVIYCFVFLYIAARGSGLISLDALINRGKVRAVNEP